MLKPPRHRQRAPYAHRAGQVVLHPNGDDTTHLSGENPCSRQWPHRGLHRVTVREISGTRLRIGPIEAIDGTPVVDVKPILVDCADAARRRQSIL
jgi:hypothetical protein